MLGNRGSSFDNSAKRRGSTSKKVVFGAGEWRSHGGARRQLSAVTGHSWDGGSDRGLTGVKIKSDLLRFTQIYSDVVRIFPAWAVSIYLDLRLW